MILCTLQSKNESGEVHGQPVRYGSRKDLKGRFFVNMLGQWTCVSRELGKSARNVGRWSLLSSICWLTGLFLASKHLNAQTGDLARLRKNVCNDRRPEQTLLVLVHECGGSGCAWTYLVGHPEASWFHSLLRLQDSGVRMVNEPQCP